MSKKVFVSAVLLATFFMFNAESASAKARYIHSVKFVCGYNDTNIGYTGDLLDKRAGEQTVKFGNYATDINIFNYNIYGFPGQTVTYVEKQILVLVEKGVPVGREPRVVRPTGFDFLELPYGQATMDDCNRIAEILWGTVPTPYPLTIGFFVIGTTDDVDVTAVYTAQTCSNWVVSPQKLECLDSTGKYADTSISIDVEQVQGHKIAD